MGITRWNKVAHCSHAWIHMLRSSMLITTITSCRIEVGNLDSRLNNKKCGEKDEKEACQLNLYPITNHGNYKSQFRIWPLWRPYFHKPHFIVCTIHSTNMSTSRWFHDVVQWLINVFSHNSWNCPWNFVLWLMRTLARAPNLLSTLSKNAYATLSLLWFDNGTNSNLAMQPLGEMFNHK
jgi:hypothetical protein